MNKLLLSLLLIALVGCSSRVYKPVLQAAIRPPNVSSAAAVSEMRKFLSTQGYELTSIATKDQSKVTPPPSMWIFSNGTDTRVEIDDDSLEKCFTLVVLVESRAIDTSSAISIGKAFLDHFQQAPGWTASTNDGCNVGPNN